MDDVLPSLLGSTVRAGLLSWLADADTGLTVSALARRTGVTPPAARAEVEKLSRWGLVRVVAVGAADLVEPNREHPLFEPIRQLVRAAGRLGPPADVATPAVRNALAAYGAPLAGARAEASMSLEDALVEGLDAARRDATVLRTLPLVIARNELRLDWEALKVKVHRAKRRAELGMLVEITADLLGRPDLRRRTADLKDARHKRQRYFFEPRSSMERKLAERNSPPAARRWGFYLNMGEDAFRSTLEKHLA